MALFRSLLYYGGNPVQFNYLNCNLPIKIFEYARLRKINAEWPIIFICDIDFYEIPQSHDIFQPTFVA